MIIACSWVEPATSFIHHFRDALHLMVFYVKFVHSAHKSLSLSKEVIRPQVPLRSPCYDFSLVTDLKLDNANKTLPH